MLRKSLHKPCLEFLEDRLPPGDILSFLFPSATLIGISLPSDQPLFDSPSGQGVTEQRSPVAFGGWDLGPDTPALSRLTAARETTLAPASQFDRSENATGLGNVENVALTPASGLDQLDSAPIQAGQRFRSYSAVAVSQSTNLEGGAQGTAPGGSSATPSTPIVAADSHAGLDQQTFAAQFLNNTGTVRSDSVENLARDGFLPPGFQGTVGTDLGAAPVASNGQLNPALSRLYDHLQKSGGGGQVSINGIPDPGAPGAYPTTRVEYNLGNITLPGTPGPVEIQAEVTYPTGLPGGVRPLVILLHGRHTTCYQGGSAFLEWPCVGSHLPIPSYKGYEYVADLLASDNYVVVSIGANGVNARDNNVTDLGAQWRAQLIQNHLDNWNTWSSVGGGPAGIGNSFIGKVDMTNIGLMGHSRGGEGVVKSYLYNQSLGSPYGINAVLPLAPVDFNRPVITNVGQLIILPYCDGDVSDNQGIHFYDDARYATPNDYGVQNTIEVLGANHNYFNTIWSPGGWPAGAADDWTAFVPGGASNSYCGTVAGNGRLSQVQERGTLTAYMTALFRTILGGEYQFYPYLTSDYAPPPSATVGSDKIIVSYHPGNFGGYREDVNRLLAPANLTTNTLGGAVTTGGLTAPYEVCGGPVPEAQYCLPTQSSSRQPHQVPSARSGLRGLSQLRLTWDTNSAFYQNDLPAGSRDVSGFYDLQFRAALNYSDTARNPVDQAQDFSITLTDGSGNSDTQLASTWSLGALNYPPGGTGSTPVPKLILNTVRIPTPYFNVDLTDVRSIRLTFDQTPRGSIFITDLMFVYY